jgi:hypothetical protein
VLQLENSTPFEAKLMLLPDEQGIDNVYTVVKATFTIGERFGLADEQASLTLTDEFYGDPASSSIHTPSDVSLSKPGTDLLLRGTAWAPNGAPTWQTDVTLSVGMLTKTIRVFGDRVWDSGPTAAISYVTPFVRMPLAWERAYGGVDQTDKGLVADSRNPVGCGFRAPGGSKPLAGMPLPNLENPLSLISSWTDRPAPAGFGPIGANWQPRASYAGTYDAEWQRTRAPYLPRDFDLRFLQVAPADQITTSYLKGGEVVDLRGVTPQGELRFLLPSLVVGANYRLDNAVQRRPAALDTILLEPDENRLVMVWRAALQCDKKALRVREVETTIQATA